MGRHVKRTLGYYDVFEVGEEEGVYALGEKCECEHLTSLLPMRPNVHHQAVTVTVLWFLV